MLSTDFPYVNESFNENVGVIEFFTELSKTNW